jgi:hypothetical protein
MSAMTAMSAIESGPRAAPADGPAGHPGISKDWGMPISPQLPATGRPLSRTIAFEDWEDPSWSRFLDPPPDPFPAAEGDRDAGRWERAHLLYGLDRLGKLTPAARLLVIATLPDAAIAALSEYAGRVEIFDLTSASERRGAEARLYWSHGALYAREHLSAHEPATSLDDLDEDAYDVVICPHGSLFSSGAIGICRLLARIERLTRHDGAVVFKAEIAAGAEPHPYFLDAGLIGAGGLASRLEDATAFAVDGGFDARLSQRTAVSVSPEGEVAPGGGSLLWRERGRIVVPSLWFLRKRRSTPQGGWDEVERWLAARVLGEQTPHLQLGVAGRRDAIGRIASTPGRKGRIFFGPYLALPQGDYEALVGIAGPRKLGPKSLSIDVVAGNRKLDYDQSRQAAGDDTLVRVKFRVPPAGIVQDGDRVEIRAWSSGIDVAFTQIRLDRAGA